MFTLESIVSESMVGVSAGDMVVIAERDGKEVIGNLSGMPYVMRLRRRISANEARKRSDVGKVIGALVLFILRMSVLGYFLKIFWHANSP